MRPSVLRARASADCVRDERDTYPESNAHRTKATFDTVGGTRSSVAGHRLQLLDDVTGDQDRRGAPYGAERRARRWRGTERRARRRKGTAGHGVTRLTTHNCSNRVSDARSPCQPRSLQKGRMSGDCDGVLMKTTTEETTRTTPGLNVASALDVSKSYVKMQHFFDTSFVSRCRSSLVSHWPNMAVPFDTPSLERSTCRPQRGAQRHSVMATLPWRSLRRSQRRCRPARGAAGSAARKPALRSLSSLKMRCSLPSAPGSCRACSVSASADNRAAARQAARFSALIHIRYCPSGVIVVMTSSPASIACVILVVFVEPEIM